MEIGDVLNEIKNDPIYIESVSNGIDVEKTILENIDKWKKYKSINTVITFAKSELTRKIQSKNDTIISGISVGQNDKFGTKLPVTFPVLVPDGKHIGVVHYDVNKIPELSRVELKIRHNSKFNNFMVTDVVKAEPMDKKLIIERLLRVAKGPDNIDFNTLQKNQVLVVRGVINWVNPAKIFKDSVVTGSMEVYLPTEDSQQRFVPVVDINLVKGGNNTVVFQLSRQRYGKPIYDIADFDAICHNAVSETPDPVEQAKIVKSGIAGRTVVGVGEIGGLKAGEKGNFINLRTFALYEYGPSSLPEQSSSGTAGQTKLYPDAAPTSPLPPKQQSKEPVASPSPAQSAPATPPASSTVAFQTSKPAPVNLIKEYGEKIRTLSRLCETGAGSFKTEELRRTLKIPEEIPDAIIEEAVSYAILPPRDD